MPTPREFVMIEACDASDQAVFTRIVTNIRDAEKELRKEMQELQNKYRSKIEALTK